MIKEMHFTKKDFRVDWYSGSGAGGQHRNKHQNCCRIIHLATGIRANGTESKSRIANQKQAFGNLVKRLVAHYSEPTTQKINTEVIRNYNEIRNEVHDKASGLKMPYKIIVSDGSIGPMIEARLNRRTK